MPKPMMTRLRNDERGQVVVLLAVVLVVLLGCAALVIDVGRAYVAKRHLQASADAAATAGALELPSPSNAQAYALNYSGRDFAKNDNNKLPSVSTTVTTKCVSIAPCNPVNAVVVEQTTVVPTIFAKVLGIDHFTIRAKATACMPCSSKPLDIMLVLDRTGSMCQFSNGTSDPACTDLQNAKAGLLEFVQYMDPTLAQDRLHGLPAENEQRVAVRDAGLEQLQLDVGRLQHRPALDQLQERRRQPEHELEPRLEDQLPDGRRLDGLRQRDRAGAGRARELARPPRRPERHRHVLGRRREHRAEYLPTTSPYRRQPCHQGITSASSVKGAGTLVYMIGYDLDAVGGGANICQSYTGANESPSILAYDTLRAMASSPDQFYYKPNPGDLTKIYGQIAADIGGTRLLDDSAS